MSIQFHDRKTLLDHTTSQKSAPSLIIKSSRCYMGFGDYFPLCIFYLLLLGEWVFYYFEKIHNVSIEQDAHTSYKMS